MLLKIVGRSNVIFRILDLGLKYGFVSSGGFSKKKNLILDTFISSLSVFFNLCCAVNIMLRVIVQELNREL